jgi:hypothetical protein
MKDPAIRDTWAKRVERWKESGLSAKEFAAELGINARSLSWWRWQLSKSDALGEGPRRRRRRSCSSAATTSLAKTLSPMTFVEMTAAVMPEPLEIVLASALRVRVPAGFDDATLRRLLDVLERRR